jgi:Ca-activated chloride channel family protein
MASNWSGMQSGDPGPEIKGAITKLGVDFGLMTQFTSFIAVEETIRTEGGVPRRVEVPVEMPAGVSYEGIFGDERKEVARSMAAPATASFGAFVRTAPPVPRQASAGRTEERDRRSQLNDQAARNQAEQAAGFRADDRKIDPALTAGLSGGAQGKIQVKVWLTDASPEALVKLKDAGFMAKAPVAGSFITGEIDAARLGDLARLSFVQYISKP